MTIADIMTTARNALTAVHRDHVPVDKCVWVVSNEIRKELLTHYALERRDDGVLRWMGLPVVVADVADDYVALRYEVAG